MSGYDKHPDYGGPAGPWSLIAGIGGTIAVALLISWARGAPLWPF